MEEYLLRFEIQEAREGIFLIPKKIIETPFSRKNDKEAHFVADNLIKEEVDRIKEAGIIIDEPKKILYKRI